MLRHVLYALVIVLSSAIPALAKSQIVVDPKTAEDVMWLQDLVRNNGIKDRSPNVSENTYSVSVVGSSLDECYRFGIRVSLHHPNSPVLQFEAICDVPFKSDETIKVRMSFQGFIGNQGVTFTISDPPVLRIGRGWWLEPDYGVLGTTLSNTIRELVEKEKERTKALAH